MVAGAAPGKEPAPPVDFRLEVRPILAGHCFKCHGPDDGARQADLRLDNRDGALKGGKSGKPAVVPHKPGLSELVRRTSAPDPKALMPPPAANLPLTAEQRDILRRWVADGAEYQPHWAFVKPVLPPLPEVKHKDWCRNEIDRFILARLDQENLPPSEPADRYTLVRRVSLDLIGLPPTPEEADAFVNDASPDAYEKLVDRLLASPHYGERWARRWMDLARYADTNGYEKDRPRSIWAWRDWVINALNADMPFDRFTVEQLAGDLLPHAALDDRIATGFHRNSMLNEEGGVDPLEYRFYAVVDRVNVTATTWLGLTMQCARCHTHKFDPIQQREYYRFMAFFNNADEPWIDVPQPDIAQKRRQQQEKIDALLADLTNQFPAELKAEWLTPAGGEFRSKNGAKAERQSDGSWLVSGDRPEKDDYTLTLDVPTNGLTHLQLEVLPDTSLPAHGPGRADDGNFVLSEITVSNAPSSAPDQRQPVKLQRAWADVWQDNYQARKAIDGKDDTGWAVHGEGDWHAARTLTVAFDGPVGAPGGTRFTVTLRQQAGKHLTLGRFRVRLGRELPDERPLAERRRQNLDRHFAQWLDHEVQRTVAWTPLHPAGATANVPTLTVEPDDSVFASGDFAKRDVYTVRFQGDWNGVRAIRLEVLPDERLPNGGPGRVAYEGPFGDFFLSNLRLLAGTNAVKFASATASYASGGNTAANAIDDDPLTGWSIDGGQRHSHNAVFVLARPLATADDLQLELVFEKYYAAALGRFRVWVTRDTNALAQAEPDDILAALGRLKLARAADPQAAPAAADLAPLKQCFAALAPELIDERDELERLRREMPKYPTTLVLEERPADHTRPTFLHKRGEFLQPAEKVEPGVPAFLPDLPPDAPRNRLGLARWLVSPDNPLTARVVMNRQWEAFFGRGLVRTTEDFGYQGELPSHPALLDWLALEFVKRGWSFKQMDKLIVMSATYRQSSRETPELREKDPENVLLARGPRFRLDAELIRDAALEASGLLSEKIGGPSVFPPQPPGVTTEGAYGPLTWTVSEGADRYRRGLYTFAKRTAPFAMFNAFDAPSGETCLARRDRSNTPLQSLTLLNDEMFLDLARALGRQAAAMDGSDEDRARRLFRRCLTRPPAAEELRQLVAFYEKQRARFKSGELKAGEVLGAKEEKCAPEPAAWAMVARVLLNLDEAITKS